MGGTGAHGGDIDGDCRGVGERTVVRAVGNGDDFIGAGHGEGGGGEGADRGRRNAGTVINTVGVGITADSEAPDQFLEVGDTVVIKVVITVPSAIVESFSVHGVQTRPLLAVVGNVVQTGAVTGQGAVGARIAPAKEVFDFDVVRKAIAIGVV